MVVFSSHLNKPIHINIDCWVYLINLLICHDLHSLATQLFSHVALPNCPQLVATESHPHPPVLLVAMSEAVNRAQCPPVHDWWPTAWLALHDVVVSDVAAEKQSQALFNAVEGFDASSLKHTDTKEKVVLPAKEGASNLSNIKCLCT